MKITKLKRSGNKYEVTINDNKYTFYADTLIRFNILHPMEIDNNVFEELISINNFYEGYYSAIKYLSFKQRSRFEIEKKLKLIGLKNSDIEKVINKLYEDNYLNDSRYISSYINDAISLTNKGPLKIKMELEKHRFSNINLSDYFTEEELEQRIKNIVSKRKRMAKNISNNEFKKKISSELQRLGYEYSTYESIVNNVSINDEDAYEKLKSKAINRYSKKYSGKTLETKVNAYLYSKGFYK